MGVGLGDPKTGGGGGTHKPRVPKRGFVRPLAPPGGGTGLCGGECGECACAGTVRRGVLRLPSAFPGSLRHFPAPFGISRLPSAFPGPFILLRLFPSSLGPSRLPSSLSVLSRPFPPLLGPFRALSALSGPSPQCRCHGRWSPLSARSVLPRAGGDARSVLPGPGGRAQRAPEPVRDGLRAGDLGGGAGRGRGAGAAAAGAARGPRGARPGGVHGPALRQPERAPRRVPPAAAAGGSVRRPHPRRGHPAAPRLLLRPPSGHRAAAGARRRPRGHRQRRQDRPAQGRRAGAPRALRSPPAPPPGPRCPPRCPGPKPAGRGPPGRVGPAGHLRGHGTAGLGPCPGTGAASVFRHHAPPTALPPSQSSPTFPPWSRPASGRTANHRPCCPRGRSFAL